MIMKESIKVLINMIVKALGDLLNMSIKQPIFILSSPLKQIRIKFFIAIFCSVVPGNRGQDWQDKENILWFEIIFIIVFWIAAWSMTSKLFSTDSSNLASNWNWIFRKMQLQPCVPPSHQSDITNNNYYCLTTSSFYPDHHCVPPHDFPKC